MVKKYRKKPLVVEAVQWNGNNHGELSELFDPHSYRVQDQSILIETLEGTMAASRGDWIIKGMAGEFYPCKPEIFQVLYEEE